MRDLLKRVRLSFTLIGVAVVAGASILSILLIQVQKVAEENKELRSVSETLVRQLESMGQQPAARPSPGATGEQGEKGDKGDVGPRGPQGPEGPPGTDGQSVQGVPGQPGESIVGPSGINGKDGSDGKSIQGPKGDAGANGKDGAPGPQGPQGERGANGTDGRTPTSVSCPILPSDASGYMQCTVTSYE